MEANACDWSDGYSGSRRPFALIYLLNIDILAKYFQVRGIFYSARVYSARVYSVDIE